MAQDKHIRLLKYIFCLLVLCLCLYQHNSDHVYAANKVTAKTKIARVGIRHYMPGTSVSYPGPWYSQGATLTKKYYIFTEWNKNTSRTRIVMCKRSNSSKCVKSSQYSYGHANSLYHQWNTDNFLVYGSSNSKQSCWSISKRKPVKNISTCSTGFIGKSTHSVPQGSTKYGKYYLRVFGNSEHSKYIALYKQNGKHIV